MSLSDHESGRTPTCSLCGKPMPPGEEMFKFHGYSGPCPKSTPKEPAPSPVEPAGAADDARHQQEVAISASGNCDDFEATIAELRQDLDEANAVIARYGFGGAKRIEAKLNSEVAWRDDEIKRLQALLKSLETSTPVEPAGAHVETLHQMVGMAGEFRQTLLTVRECIDALTPGHRTGYDWNADPLYMTRYVGDALKAIDAGLTSLNGQAAVPTYRNVYIVTHYPDGGLRGVHASQAGAEAEIADLCREYPEYSRRDFSITCGRIRPFVEPAGASEPPSEAALLRNIRMSAAMGLSFGHQATPQPLERMVERKDKRLRQILTLLAEHGVTGSMLRAEANEPVDAAPQPTQGEPEPCVWRDIASAPKDETPIRLKWAGTTVEAIGRWCPAQVLPSGFGRSNYSDDWRDVEGDDVLLMPTHWKPVSLDDSDEWKPLPAPVSPVEPTPEPPTRQSFDALADRVMTPEARERARDIAAELLAGAPAPCVWREMDSAPKDGTVILVHGGIAYWYFTGKDSEGEWRTLTGVNYPGEAIKWPVTEWMPMPSFQPLTVER